MKVWDLRLSVCKLLSISHMNECLRRLIVPVVARGTATKNSMSSVIILCVDILLLLEPLQSLQRWALICDIITRDTNECVQQSTQQGSYKLSLSLWVPSLIPGSSSNNKPSGLFILALLWKEPLQIILQSLSWWRTISSTFIIVCIIFIFLTAGRRWRPWWWSTGRCLVRDKQHVIAQFKHFHLNSFITDRTNETFTDRSNTFILSWIETVWTKCRITRFKCNNQMCPYMYFKTV